MGLVQPGIPDELALRLKTWFGLETFVETGTYLGRTARWASGHFKEVYTLEASENLWRQAKTAHADRPNIRFIHGHSGEFLHKVLADIHAPTLFWLDGHWSSGVTYGKNDECPLLDELDAIRAKGGDNYIFIDDARLFMSPPPLPHRLDQWPTLNEVLVSLSSANENPYTVIVQDVIISVPSLARRQFSEYLQQMMTAIIANQDRPLKARLRQSIQALFGK